MEGNKTFLVTKDNRSYPKKWDGYIPFKMSGKNIKSNLPSTEKTHTNTEKPEEEIQLDFIGSITEKNGRFYILFR